MWPEANQDVVRLIVQQFQGFLKIDRMVPQTVLALKRFSQSWWRVLDPLSAHRAAGKQFPGNLYPVWAPIR